MSTAAELLKCEIRDAFEHVPFPGHRGLRAAMAMDNWISDAAQLANITADQDIHGEWWDILVEELRACSLGITYLDAAGFEFYLPAYLTAALNHHTYADYRVALTLSIQTWRKSR